MIGWNHNSQHPLHAREAKKIIKKPILFDNGAKTKAGCHMWGDIKRNHVMDIMETQNDPLFRCQMAEL